MTTFWSNLNSQKNKNETHLSTVTSHSDQNSSDGNLLTFCQITRFIIENKFSVALKGSSLQISVGKFTASPLLKIGSRGMYYKTFLRPYLLPCRSKLECFTSTLI
jgi:hypothetical protein